MIFNLFDSLTGSNKGERTADIQDRAGPRQKTDSSLTACVKKKRNVFSPRPVLVPLQLSLSSSTHHHHPLIPLIFFPSQPSCSLHTLGLSQLPCPHNYHHHWECGKRVQSPTPGRGCRPRWSQPQNPLPEQHVLIRSPFFGTCSV